MPKLRTLQPRVQTIGSKVKPLQGGAWRAGKTSAQRGYGYKWQKARERFLAYDPWCRMCWDEGKRTRATVVDHIIPHRGDQTLFWNQGNWQPLCAKHHGSDKQKQENAENY
ncbi:MAG: HNH endonuclease [Pseudomonadales bacterium]|nr:HNH endonuclease [Pseudomonadales bacterium]